MSEGVHLHVCEELGDGCPGNAPDDIRALVVVPFCCGGDEGWRVGGGGYVGGDVVEALVGVLR